MPNGLSPDSNKNQSRFWSDERLFAMVERVCAGVITSIITIGILKFFEHYK